MSSTPTHLHYTVTLVQKGDDHPLYGYGGPLALAVGDTPSGAPFCVVVGPVAAPTVYAFHVEQCRALRVTFSIVATDPATGSSHIVELVQGPDATLLWTPATMTLGDWSLRYEAVDVDGGDAYMGGAIRCYPDETTMRRVQEIDQIILSWNNAAQATSNAAWQLGMYLHHSESALAAHTAASPSVGPPPARRPLPVLPAGSGDEETPPLPASTSRRRRDRAAGETAMTIAVSRADESCAARTAAATAHLQDLVTEQLRDGLARANDRLGGAARDRHQVVVARLGDTVSRLARVETTVKSLKEQAEARPHEDAQLFRQMCDRVAQELTAVRLKPVPSPNDGEGARAIAETIALRAEVRGLRATVTKQNARTDLHEATIADMQRKIAAVTKIASGMVTQMSVLEDQIGHQWKINQ